MTEYIPTEPRGDMAPGPVSPVQARPQSAAPSGYAIAAFVLGILSFVTCGPCAGLPAFIIGMIELRQIKDRTSPAEGKGFALAGTIMGGISTALAILVILFYIGIVLLAILAHGAFGLE